jgi:hypothetical protein
MYQERQILNKITDKKIRENPLLAMSQESLLFSISVKDGYKMMM